MKKVMVFGTFDILHQGHLDLFRQAREHGDFLIAVVARDRTVEEVKGEGPEHDEKERLAEVAKHVDKAVLGHLGSKHQVIEEEKPDVLCLGYDQEAFTKDLEKFDIPIIRLNPFAPETYKSSKLKNASDH